MHHVYYDCTQNNAATSHKVLYNYETISRAGKVNGSPWAVKKINSKCATKQLAVYQKRLNEEAKLLKGINHPNIVGKIQQSAHFKGRYVLCLLNIPLPSLNVYRLFNLVLYISHIKVFVHSPQPKMAPNVSLWSTEERNLSTTLLRRGERMA